MFLSSLAHAGNVSPPVICFMKDSIFKFTFQDPASAQITACQSWGITWASKMGPGDERAHFDNLNNARCQALVISPLQKKRETA